MNADVTAIVPAATIAKVCALTKTLQLPDVTAMDLEKMPAEDLATLAFFLEQRLLAARVLFDDACAAATAAAAQARDLVRGTIIDNGGKALAHDTFDVRLVQTTRKEKRIDVLRTLKGLLPDDLYREAVFIESVDVSHAETKAIEAVVAAGGKPTWGANLTKLNKHARDFGGDIARIVEAGSPSVDVGAPKLVIEPRPSAMKAVN